MVIADPCYGLDRDSDFLAETFIIDGQAPSSTIIHSGATKNRLVLTMVFAARLHPPSEAFGRGVTRKVKFDDVFFCI